jgi:hypothetical protein
LPVKVLCAIIIIIITRKAEVALSRKSVFLPFSSLAQEHLL